MGNARVGGSVPQSTTLRAGWTQTVQITRYTREAYHFPELSIFYLLPFIYKMANNANVRVTEWTSVLYALELQAAAELRAEEMRTQTHAMVDERYDYNLY